MTYRRFNDSPDDSSIGSVCGSDQHQDETVTSTNTDLLTLAHCSRSVCGESTSSRSTSYPHTSYHDPNSFSASVTHAKVLLVRDTMLLSREVSGLLCFKTGIVLNVLNQTQYLKQCFFLANEITSEIASIQRKCQNLHFVIAYWIVAMMLSMILCKIFQYFLILSIFSLEIQWIQNKVV